MGAVVGTSMLVIAVGASFIWPVHVESPLILAIGLILAASVGYNVAAILALIGFARDRATRSAMAGERSAPPITILKPLCGNPLPYRDLSPLHKSAFHLAHRDSGGGSRPQQQERSFSGSWPSVLRMHS